MFSGIYVYTAYYYATWLCHIFYLFPFVCMICSKHNIDAKPNVASNLEMYLVNETTSEKLRMVWFLKSYFTGFVGLLIYTSIVL